MVPPTVIEDAAGALGLVFGMVCALFDARRSASTQNRSRALFVLGDDARLDVRTAPRFEPLDRKRC